MKIILSGVNCALKKCSSTRSHTISISSITTNQVHKIETNLSMCVKTAILCQMTELSIRHMLIDIGT